MDTRRSQSLVNKNALIGDPNKSSELKMLQCAPSGSMADFPTSLQTRLSNHSTMHKTVRKIKYSIGHVQSPVCPTD